MRDSSQFSPIADAIAAFRAGRMVILVYDEERENEGDLAIAAEKVTPEAIAFMATHGRGLICLALTEERCDQLGLPPMVAENTSPFGTAFTVSIEARGKVTTGISAADRAATVRTAIDLAPDHISAYALIIEEGTQLARQIRRGEVPAPDDDLQADMYELVDDLLAAAGFDWYEVSNWATSPAHRSRHNLAYWRGTDWWGYGPGAHSHVDGLRWWNVKHPAAYAQRLAAGQSPAAARERPDAAARRLEDVLLRSRISDGLAVSELEGEGRHAVASLIADGLIDGAAAVRGRVVLTRRGRLLADAVVRALTA